MLKDFYKKRAEKKQLIHYKEWRSKPVGKKIVPQNHAEKEVNVDCKTYRSVKVMVSEKASKFAKKLEIDISLMKAHQARKISQFRQIKAIRKQVEDDITGRTIAIRMDWSENAELFQCRQEKSAYYHDVHISVNIAVVYTPGSVISVGSLSDVTDHKNVAVWASLYSISENMNLDLAQASQIPGVP